MGLSLAGHSGVGLGLRALQVFACVDPVTVASGFPYRLSFDGELGRCSGTFGVNADTSPYGSEDTTPGSCARVRVLVLPRRVRLAGLPGAFWCASLFIWPLCLSALLGPLRLGLPLSCSFACLLSSVCCFFLRCFFCVPWLSPAFSDIRPWSPWTLALSFPVLAPRLDVLLLLFFYFSPWLCALVVSGLLWFPAPGALGLGAVSCLFCWSPASQLSVRSSCFCVSRLAVGCSLVAAAPPPFCVSRFLSCRWVPLFFSFFLFCSALPALRS